MVGARKNESAITREYRERAEKAEATLANLGERVKEIAEKKGLCETAREVAEEAGVPWPQTEADIVVTVRHLVRVRTSLDLENMYSGDFADLLTSDPELEIGDDAVTVLAQSVQDLDLEYQ